MLRTVEVEIDDAGRIHMLDRTEALPPGRALLSWNTADDHEAYLVSEAALAQDWLRPEEDEAWAHLQPAR